MILSSFLSSLCRVRNKITYVLSWRTVSAFIRALFWCLFLSLLRNSGNEHKHNPLVSAETVRHSLCMYSSDELFQRLRVKLTTVTKRGPRSLNREIERGPRLVTVVNLTVIQAEFSNDIHYKLWDEITYQFPNFNGATVEVWKWISNIAERGLPRYSTWLTRSREFSRHFEY